MIWQRSVVAKEKVRTIEVNDYGLFPMKTLQKIIGIMNIYG